MAYDQWDRNGFQSGPYRPDPYQTPPRDNYGPGYGQAPERRVDLLDVVEGVLRDGFSFTNFSRIARASGSNFWIGAAIGAGLVVLANRPDIKNILKSGAHPSAAPHPFKGKETNVQS